MTQPPPSDITPSSTPRTGLRSPWILGALAVAAVCAAIVFWPPADRGPEATLLFGKDEATVRPFDEVPTFDPMVLRLELPAAAWVYVASFDYRRGTICYYPTEFLGTDHARGKADMHRFEAGTWDLPGTWDGKAQSWFVPDADGAFSLCVVASPTRLTDLEAVLPLCRQVGNRAFQARSMGHYMPRAGRDKVVGQKEMPHPILQAAQHQEDALLPGPMAELQGHPGVFVKTFNIRPCAPRPGVTPPSNPLQGQLKRMAEDQIQVSPTPAKK